ncbi:MAG: haloacid dehalogenase-like hydrolase [Clostridia bacterium]|nr:haloacid dehalogenase-like hydrolase [Clostridia bacterium]
MKKTTVAICYDFDKTLSVDDMQSFSFIPKLGLKPIEFWGMVRDFSKKNGCEPTLAYLYVMKTECEKKGIVLNKEYLHNLGADIKFFSGVSTWFDRINRFGEEQNVKVEHYIISSGNKEMIDGCKIAKYFTGVFGCEYLFDKRGEACWPKNIVNFTQKTQYLFRICKGATDLSDQDKVNSRVDNKHVEFRNMIYIGDGVTDIPCMTLVKEKGGIAISVYTPEKKQESVNLLDDDRVDYACKSDFSSDSELEKLVKLVITSMALKEKLVSYGNKN